MAGEPEWFDVTKLECVEIDEPGHEVLSNIIDWGESFYLRATFTGEGREWDNMRRNGFEYVVEFYAEGMGPEAETPDQNFGQTTGNLNSGQNEYEVNSPVQQINAEGIWRCNVMVTFRGCDHRRWYGVLGFNEDCVIQVHYMEEEG